MKCGGPFGSLPSFTSSSTVGTKHGSQSTFEELIRQGKRSTEANQSYRSSRVGSGDSPGRKEPLWLNPYGLISADRGEPKRITSDEEIRPPRTGRNRITRQAFPGRSMEECSKERHERGSSLDIDAIHYAIHRRTVSAEPSMSQGHSFRNLSLDRPRFGSTDVIVVENTVTSPGDRTEVQKHLLKKDIETRQLKLSQQRGRIFPQEDEEYQHELIPSKRLLVIYSRLPVTLHYEEESGFTYSKEGFETNVADTISQLRQEARSLRRGSHALLATAAEKISDVILMGVPVLRRKGTDCIMDITEELQRELSSFLWQELQMIPVFTPPNRDRFATGVLFPLFHYSPPSVETGLGQYDWEGYELVNEKFRDAVIREYRREDLVWINDYSLMVLPKMLRRERPDIHIGYYMACVFPSSEIYRVLPQREDLLRGVLSANFIAFHNFQYVRHFLTSCTRVLGLECTAAGIEACEDAGGTCTKVLPVPLGMDLGHYQRTLQEEETAIRVAELDKIFHGQDAKGDKKKLLVALDRLEEKKGIPHKIMAFHKFLQKEPKWATKCVFVQIVERVEDSSVEDTSESAADSVAAQNLLQQIYQMVGECNSKFGKIGHLPVHFIHQDFIRNRVDLAALVVNADVFIDTPLRDMTSNSATMFLCCQESQKCGALILSEFSGSAQSLRASALTVNPWDTEGFADAIQEALEMPPNERSELHRYGHKRVLEYTNVHWAMNFLDEFVTAVDECEKERLEIPPQLDHEKAVTSLMKAKRRVVILGFSGTLLPRRSRWLAHTKILPRLPEVLLGNLQVMAEEPNTDVIVMSGLGKDVLTQALNDVPCWIIAEGGFCYREPAVKGEWHSTEEQRDAEWMGPVQEIMEFFAARTPGSTVIKTSSTVSWHYQKTQGDHAAIQSKDMLIHLWAGPLMSSPAEVIVGTDSVTVRPTGVSKASMLETILRKICCEENEDRPTKWLTSEAFIICITDLLIRDEDVYVTVQKLFECDGTERMANRQPATQFDGGPFDESCRRGLTEREQHLLEEMHFEANSKSMGALNDVFGRLTSSAIGNLQRELDDEAPFGLHKSDVPFGLRDVFPDTPVMTKAPSEPDLERKLQADMVQLTEATDDMDEESASLFTCAVTRKGTRASHHLSDTNDVAFLIAQFARELRRVGHDC